MVATVNIYSNKKGELNKFLSHFHNTDLDIENELKWVFKIAKKCKMWYSI